MLAMAGCVLVGMVAVGSLAIPGLTILGGVGLALASVCLAPVVLMAVIGVLAPVSERLRGSMFALALVELRATATRSSCWRGWRPR